MLFHEASGEVYSWLKKQPNVKEESLTDWLLYYISEHCLNVYYKEFTRYEESNNGADWEWWILTSEYNGYSGYRFLVQAKKLFVKNKDNYSLLSYGNKNGYQIDLLMNAAKVKSAFPLYMFYSTAPTDIKKQINEFTEIDSSVISWCKDCLNGCYLSPAKKIYDELYNFPRHKLIDTDILNKSLKLSLLDMLFGKDVDSVLSHFNKEYILSNNKRTVEYNYNGVTGIKHYGDGIPKYLRLFVERRGEDMDWFQDEMNINDIAGIGVLDFRLINEY